MKPCRRCGRDRSGETPEVHRAVCWDCTAAFMREHRRRTAVTVYLPPELKAAVLRAADLDGVGPGRYLRNLAEKDLRP